MNYINPLETNPANPGYRNPATGVVNPGYTTGTQTSPVYTGPALTSTPPFYPQANTPVTPGFTGPFLPDETFVVTKTYAFGDPVTFGGNRYTSLTNSNVSHQPGISPAFWTLANTPTAPSPLDTTPATLADVAIRTVHLETLARSLSERMAAVEAKHQAIHNATK
jgi:hypothetical protein